MDKTLKKGVINMDKKLKIGIVGASGWMAGALAIGAEYEKEFNPKTKQGEKSKISKINALCDLDEKAMQERKDELNLDSAELFTSYDKMLKSENIDAVIVAVPNNLHADFAIKALEAEKHVFLEKPYATTKEDSKRLLETAVKSKKTTKLDYILFHYDEQEKLRNLIKNDAFGQMASTYFSYRHPIKVSDTAEQIWKLSKEKTGGAIPMGTCHAISLTVLQVDANPVSVTCQSAPSKIRNFDYDTQQDIMVSFDNGVRSLIQGNIDFAEKYDARHTIIGTGGQFDYTPYNPLESRIMWSSKKFKREYSADASFANDHLDSGNVWEHKCGKTIKSFVEYALKDKKDPLMGLESKTIQRIEKIIWASELSAAENGKTIVC
ncbi:MAG: Gfo/Idh/MocA family oxidoreductase [Verrucomicrobiota bacterium]|nr:Gfo/Idh/MocA family oxidoreductase [Verrucomicrobiota bacterium]